MFFDELFIVSECVIDKRWTAITFSSPIVCGLHIYIELCSQGQEGVGGVRGRPEVTEGEVTRWTNCTSVTRFDMRRARLERGHIDLPQ